MKSTSLSGHLRASGPLVAASGLINFVFINFSIIMQLCTLENCSSFFYSPIMWTERHAA